MSDRLPADDRVDPAFDGHPERPFAAWTTAEKLDWIWEAMTLLRAGEAQRAARRPPSSGRGP